MKHSFRLFLAAFLCGIVSSCLPAKETGSLDINLSPQLSFYVDPGRVLGIEEVSNNNFQDQFVSNRKRSTPYWMENSAVWGKIRLQDLPSGQKLYFYLHHPVLQHLDFYFPTGKEKFQKLKSGHELALQERPYPSRKIVVPIPEVPPGSEIETIYFRAYSPEAEFNLNLRLVNTIGLHNALIKDTAFQFTFIGIFLVMVVYNFFLYWSVRDRLYLIYCVYVTIYGLTLYGANGLLQAHFISDFLISSFITSTLAIFALVMGIVFAQNFLSLKTNLPRHYFILQICFYGSLFSIFLYVFGASVMNVSFFMFVLISQLTILSSGLSLYNKYPYTRDFTRAWSMVFISVSLYALVTIGVYIPHMATYLLQLGAAAESVLLAFALGRRMRYLQAEERLYVQVKKELALAGKVQKDLFPHAVPASGHYSLAWRYLPSAVTSGDFYDYKTVENTLSLIIADVAGHGYAAGLIASMVKVAFHETFDIHQGVKKHTEEINRILCRHIHLSYATAINLRIHPEEKEFQLVRAGHVPLLHYNAAIKKVHTHMPPGSPLGVDKNYHCTELRVSYQPGDRLLAFTDGLIEEQNGSGEEFGIERLAGQLIQDAHNSPEEFCNHLTAEIEAWKSKLSFRDDVSFLIIELK